MSLVHLKAWQQFIFGNEVRELPPAKKLVSIYSNDPFTNSSLSKILGYFINPRAAGDLTLRYKYFDSFLISKLCLSTDNFIGYEADEEY